MARKKDELGKELSELALQIVKEARATHDVVDGEEGGEPRPVLSFDQRVNAFKSVALYHLGIRKVKAKAPDQDDDDAEATTWAALTAGLHNGEKHGGIREN